MTYVIQWVVIRLRYSQLRAAALIEMNEGSSIVNRISARIYGTRGLVHTKPIPRNPSLIHPPVCQDSTRSPFGPPTPKFFPLVCLIANSSLTSQMAIKLENLIAAFEGDAGSSSNIIWNQYVKYVSTITVKQGSGLTSMLIKRSPAAKSSVFTQIKSIAIPSIVRAVSNAARKIDGRDASGSALVNFALDTLLVSTDPVRVTPNDFASLFRAVSADEFGAIVAPALTRAVRRSASRTIHNVAGILECCTVDMSVHSTDLVSALLDCVKSSELVAHVTAALGSIFRRSVSPQAQVAILKQVSDVFPRLGQQSVDVSASTVLRGLCSENKNGSELVASALVESPLVVGLFKQLRSAAIEETRIVIARSLGSVVAYIVSNSAANSASHRAALKMVTDEFVSVLTDKRGAAEAVKESIIFAIEEVCSADRHFYVGTSIVPIDAAIPLLSLLAQGRLTARATCLAAWVVQLHCLIADNKQSGTTAVDKRLAAVFTQAVSTDQTFAPQHEDSTIIRRLLRSIATQALRVPGFPVTSSSERETIALGSMTERMTNRFCSNLVAIIATGSLSSFEFPSTVSKDLANRLVFALYELVVLDRTRVPGNLARVALARIASVADRMDPEWLALLIVLSHHEYFTSKQVSTDRVWAQSVGRYVGTPLMRLCLEPLTGLVFQGGLIADKSCGFREACAKSVSRIVAGGFSDECIVDLAQSALRRIDASAVAKANDQLGVFFCPENVVWNFDTEIWIPSPDSTLAPVIVKAGVKMSTSGVTKEDLMRQSLKDQSAIRRRISELASMNQFCLEVLAVIVQSLAEADLIRTVVSLVTDRMVDCIALLKSPLTSSSARRLVDRIVAVAVSDTLLDGNSKSLLTALLHAVAMGDTRLAPGESWVAVFDSVSDSVTASAIEFALIHPLIAAALAPVEIAQFNPEVALSVMGAITRQLTVSPSDMPMSPILTAVAATARISPGPFALAIGKIVRILATSVKTQAEARLVTAIAVTDDAKLFHEVMSGIVLINDSLLHSLPVLQAFSLMGTFEESTKSMIRPISGESVVGEPVVTELVNLLDSEPLVQRLASEALAWICTQPTASTATLYHLLDMCCSGFTSHASSENSQTGFARALGAVGKVPLGADLDFLTRLVKFVVGSAMAQTDLSDRLRDQLLSAIQDALAVNAESHAMELISLVEQFIGSKAAPAALAVPVLLGLLCKFLPASHEKVTSVRTKLVSELLTSEIPVQTKIATVLPPLLKMSEDVAKYLESFLNTALSTSDARARYGAAMGVGSAVKAQGVAILRQLEVLKRVQVAAEDRSSTDRRQGAIAVYGGLSLSLGRLFEPYVAQVLPVLLVAFSDNQAAVRDASNMAASQIMANLSSHGIKLVLPSLLAGIEDMQWRTKLGSIKLLSAMVNCAPKQLATCLPKIVPALSEVATDTHAKVKEAACAALTEVGAVIGNPEIKACASKLIASLTDPANDSLRQVALDVLLSTSFVHSLDAASLALVIPVMLRATRERRSEIKRKGAQILGSIAVLSADPTEGLGPYMHKIVPALQDVLIDPIPDVRATAAKALGTMARALPETIVAEVLPWLFQTLRQAESQVERSGAAHGLSEVLVELGPEHFAQILPEVVASAVNPATNPEAREGYMGLFVFLPGVMRNAFVPHIETVFPVLVQGLSDPLQPVREVALRAASALCAQFSVSHATMLMPSLEKGLFAKDWRARQAAVQLTGHTLESLMKNSRGNKDNLLECQVPLAQERRSYMLAMLYIVRSDPNQAVNHNAQSVWKNVVANTPRTLRLILPILVRLIISNLSSSGEETRQMLAGRCLGDLVGKLGERVLPDLMPILVENMQSGDATVRAGVCVGLADIVNAAHRQLLQEYFSLMFPAVRSALCDESPVVRAKAGTLVGVLHTAVGNTTVNSTLPAILEMVNQESTAQSAIHGLEQLVSALPRELLPVVLDALAVEQPTGAKIRAMETIAQAPQAELAKYVTRVVPYLMTAFATCPEECLHAGNELFGHFNKHSCHLAMIELVRGLGDKTNGQLREACASLLASCVKCSPVEVVGEYVDTLVVALIRGMLADAYLPAMEASLAAFAELTNKMTKESMMKYMADIKKTIDDVIAPGDCPGLGLPRTFETLWPVYQQALMFGGTESREAAAKGLVVLVEKTPTDRLKPNAIKVTGPLIRVLGDRYPANVRVALLKTLQVLLQRLESALKPFLPQLQTTYQKCAQDTDEGVRQLAEASQALLTRLAPAAKTAAE